LTGRLKLQKKCREVLFLGENIELLLLLFQKMKIEKYMVKLTDCLQERLCGDESPLEWKAWVKALLTTLRR